MISYEPGLMMLRQAMWAFDNRIRAVGTRVEHKWQGLYEHFLSECDVYEENEKALRCSAGQEFIKCSEPVKDQEHLTRISA